MKSPLLSIFLVLFSANVFAGFARYESNWDNTESLYNSDEKKLLSNESSVQSNTLFLDSSKKFQCFHSNRSYLFSSDQYKTIKSIRFDSLEINTDTVLISFPSLCRIDSNRLNLDIYSIVHYSTSLSSWVGRKVIINPNGMNTFLNRYNDSIIINTKAALGDSWKMWQHDTLRIMAKVSSINQIELFGKSENIKVISLQTLNTLGIPMDSLNFQTQIWLSENYGLIQFPDFYYFPYKSDDYYSLYDDKNILVGIPELNLGFKNLTTKDIFDFQAGDELHIVQSDFTYGKGSESKRIIKILERNDSATTITYKQQIRESLRTVDYNYKETYEYKDFIEKTTINAYYELDILPGELITYWENQNGLPLYRMSSNDPNIKYLNQIDLFWDNEDKNWSNYTHTDGGGYDYYDFRKGLGGPYYTYSSIFSMGGSRRELVYFQKGDSVWGTPILNVGFEETKDESIIIVNRNYKNSQFTIKSDTFANGNFNIFIYDAQGRLKFNTELNSNLLELDLQSWMPGMYFYNITQNATTIKSGKFIFTP